MLKDALGEGRVVAPDFDMHDPEEALRHAKEAIAADPSISLAVGTSMGGFVALCLQQIPRIAINPCTRPSAILGDDAKGIERWLWEWAFDLESASDVRLAVFGGKDAVCPWAYDDYESAGGMRAMLPHVDSFRTCHNLASLEDLAQALTQPEDARARHGRP